MRNPKDVWVKTGSDIVRGLSPVDKLASARVQRVPVHIGGEAL